MEKLKDVTSNDYLCRKIIYIMIVHLVEVVNEPRIETCLRGLLANK